MPDANQATGSEGGYEKCGIQYCHSPCIAVEFMACRIEQLTGVSIGPIFLGPHISNMFSNSDMNLTQKSYVLLFVLRQ